MSGYAYRDATRTTQEQITAAARSARKLQAELAALNEHHRALELDLAAARERVAVTQRKIHAAKTDATRRGQAADEECAQIIAEAEQRANVIREVAQQQASILCERGYDEGWRLGRDHIRAKRRTIREYTRGLRVA